MVNRDEKPDVNCPLAHEADKLIAGLGGDARAAVIELIALVEALKRSNEQFAASASRGFSRSDFLRWP
jgi:hypothetical protein